MSSEIPPRQNDTHEDDQQRSKRKPHNTKYALPNNTNLRRDLLLSNFDRNLVVEKARFEPNNSNNNNSSSNSNNGNSNNANSSASVEDLGVGNTTQSAPNIATQLSNLDVNLSTCSLPRIETTANEDDLTTDNEHNLLSPPSTYALTTSPSAPTLTTNTNSNHTNNSAFLGMNPLTLTHSASDKRKANTMTLLSPSRPTTNRKLNKKQSKPMMHGTTASPAEVFHRNLVDAVSNVEDSDENEHYVYPYSGNESIATNGIHRPLSVRSTPASLMDSKKKSGKGLGEWLRQIYQKPQQPVVDEEEEDLFWSGGEQNQRRPKLRSHVKDHPSQQPSNRSSLLNLWHDSFSKKYASSKKSSIKKYYSTQSHSPQYLRYTRNGGYTSDDEEAPLLFRRQKRSFSKSSKKSCNHTLQNLVLSAITLLVIMLIVIVYKAQPLMKLTVDMGRVLATDKELIFDLKVQAENWNWWTIHVADADISVFAFSQIVPSTIITEGDFANASSYIRGVDPAEYLGALTHFDEPLSIPSLHFSKEPIEAISQIRIKSPGADTSGNERWSRMIRYPYSLVVRGVLKYKPTPFVLGTYPQSIAICNVTQVDPTTGAVSTDPDRTICSSSDEVNVFSHGTVVQLQ